MEIYINQVPSGAKFSPPGKCRFVEPDETIQPTDYVYNSRTFQWELCNPIYCGRLFTPIDLGLRNWVCRLITPKKPIWTDGNDGWIYYNDQPAFLINASLPIDATVIIDALNKESVGE
jgi:hypothetical protein